MKSPRVSSAPSPPRGRSRSNPIRSFPGQEKSLVVMKGMIRVGTSSIRPSGRACSWPPESTYVLREASLVGERCAERPRSSISPRPPGFSDSMQSGPPSTMHPSTLSVTTLPPTRAEASITLISRGSPGAYPLGVIPRRPPNHRLLRRPPLRSACCPLPSNLLLLLEFTHGRSHCSNHRVRKGPNQQGIGARSQQAPISETHASDHGCNLDIQVIQRLQVL